MSDDDSIYELAGEVYRPTRWAGSPWSTSMQHGGPVNGLFAREAERTADGIGMHVARLTIDLFKAVPMAPLVADTRLLRQGKRIAALESVIHPPGDERPVARATGLLLRPTPHDEDLWQTPELAPPSFEGTRPPRSQLDGVAYELPPGFHERVEVRPGVDAVGPYVWITTPLELIAGETITALQRATALTDMTLGTQMRMAHLRPDAPKPAAARGRTRGLLINTDTTVYWERAFVGPHLGLRPSLITEADGIGTAEAVLYDARGRVGRSLQCALLKGGIGGPAVAEGGRA